MDPATSPAQSAASTSPTPHSETNRAVAMAMMAAAASTRAPNTPGGPPSLPPVNNNNPIHADVNEGDEHEGRAGHRVGDGDEFDGGEFVDGEDGFDDDLHEGAEELDASAAGYSWERRVMHFLRGEWITSVTRPLVELAVLMEAGIFVSGLGPMKNEEKWPKMRTKYISCVSEFGHGDFQSLEVRDQMQTQMYRAKGALDGKRLWEKYGIFRSELRKMTAEFPRNLASMPSGNQLHDVYLKFLVERYRKLYVSVDGVNCQRRPVFLTFCFCSMLAR